jgi:hypothetical protein
MHIHSYIYIYTREGGSPEIHAAHCHLSPLPLLPLFLPPSFPSFLPSLLTHFTSFLPLHLQHLHL